MTLATPGLLRSTRTLDVSLSLLSSAKALKDRARVHFHAYTSETIAEVVLVQGKQVEPGTQVFARLRLENPALLLPGDHFILRQFSPVVTIGGGEVIDAAPLPRTRSRKFDVAAHSVLLRDLLNADPQVVLLARIARRGSNGLALPDALAETGWAPARVAAAATMLVKSGGDRKVVRAGPLLVSHAAFLDAQSRLLAALAKFHDANPLVAAMSKGELRERLDLPPEVFSGVLDDLARQKKVEISGETVRTAGRGVAMKDEEAESKRTIEQAFASAGLQVPLLKDVLASLPVDKSRAQKLVTLLLRDRVLVKLSDDLVFHRDALGHLREKLRAYKSKSPKIGVPQFKELMGITRKYAIPLLEYLDRERITKRVGDERVIL